MPHPNYKSLPLPELVEKALESLNRRIPRIIDPEAKKAAKAVRDELWAWQQGRATVKDDDFIRGLCLVITGDLPPSDLK